MAAELAEGKFLQPDMPSIPILLREVVASTAVVAARMLVLEGLG